jgi:tRNA splicing ligase
MLVEILKQYNDNMKQDESHRARTIQSVVTIRPLKSTENDFAYWQSQSYQLRIAALEQIRQEYSQWRHIAQPGLQRVYTIVKR